MLKNLHWNWYQVALVAILAAALIGSYFLPDDARAELRRDAGYVWAIAASLFGPLVRKRVQDALAKPSAGTLVDGGGES